MFLEKYSEEIITKSIESSNIELEIPKYQDVDKWNSISPEIRNEIIESADQYIDFSWSGLQATKFMEFKRVGLRDDFQSVYFKKRTALIALVFGECLQRKGRFLDDIINGIWSICEESAWWIHAHNYMALDGGKEPLPNVQEPIIDLFAAETGAMLSVIYHIMIEVLDETSVIIGKRIKHEIEEKIIKPFFEREDFWWMGFVDQGIQISNWTTWCSKNCLITFAIMEDDKERLAKAVNKTLKSLDKFADIYPSDGACTEGPNYWGAAGAALFDCIDILYKITQGAINEYSNKLLHEIGKFIYRAYISNSYYVNFSDTNMSISPSASKILRFGKGIEDEQMILFSGMLHQMYKSQHKQSHSHDMYQNLMDLFGTKELDEIKGEYKVLRDVWLKESHFMVARENSSSEGFYIAAKGGHNDETHHNHNDIGNFMIYYGNTPVIVDVGKEPYTAQCFGDERYSIWYTRSDYHNLPIVNGHVQSPGEEYKATDVEYTHTDSNVRLSMNIVKAYPKEAGIVSLIRNISMQRDGSCFIEIVDDIVLEKATDDVKQVIMTLAEPLINEEEDIIIEDKFLLKYDKNLFTARYEKIDKIKLSKEINHCYRILFQLKVPAEYIKSVIQVKLL